ncbi:MAG: FAD-dependent oxidoreductase [Clostridium sp.]|nr:FAD-dependent oxidoreductase [Clostridium sp.]
MFNLESIPESLMVIGGGAIGTEMAQAFSRLGSKVTLAQMDKYLMPNGDEEAAGVLELAFKRENISVYNSTTIKNVKKENEKIVIETDKGNFITDKILVATGRQPVLESLALDKAGIVYTKKRNYGADSKIYARKKLI